MEDNKTQPSKAKGLQALEGKKESHAGSWNFYVLWSTGPKCSRSRRRIWQSAVCSSCTSKQVNSINSREHNSRGHHNTQMCHSVSDTFTSDIHFYTLKLQFFNMYISSLYFLLSVQNVHIFLYFHAFLLLAIGDFNIYFHIIVHFLFFCSVFVVLLLSLILFACLLLCMYTKSIVKP